MDRFVVPMNTSTRSRITLNLYLSEESLTKLKEQNVELVITERKVLKRTLAECAMMGHVHRVKLIQFSMPVINGTMLVKTNQAKMGILKHAVTIFPKEIHLKQASMEKWRLRKMGDRFVIGLFDRFSDPHPIMNILIWNCRGAIKPKFKQMVSDLVSWHHLTIMVITKTRVVGYKAKEVIKGLPFDGYVVSKTIGFAGGIWLLWNSSMLHVEELSLME